MADRMKSSDKVEYETRSAGTWRAKATAKQNKARDTWCGHVFGHFYGNSARATGPAWQMFWHAFLSNY